MVRSVLRLSMALSAMRNYPISHPVLSSCAVLGAGLLLFTEPFQRTQAAENAPAAAKPAANGGLFPDAEPVLVEKATLRTLLDALGRKDGETTAPIIWQLLAVMSKSKDQGVGPSEYLAAGYKAERLKGTDAAAVQNCLLSAWAGAQSLALFTPDNIARMERGGAPYGTRGADRGRPVSFDTTALPSVTLTTIPTRKAVAVATPVPATEAKPVAPSFTVKTLEVKLHEKIPLDQFGIRDRDFSLESVDPHNSVVFTFEDRVTHRYGYGDRMDTLNQLSQQMGSANGLNRMTTFAPQDIPDTKMRGVKLVTIPFGAIYVDEDVGGFTYKVVIRVASEALMLDQLPPERRKLYDLRSPAP